MGQKVWTCSFNYFNPGETVEFSSISEKDNRKIDSLLFQFGLEKKYRFMLSANYEGITALGGKDKNDHPFRTIYITGKVLDSTITPIENINLFYELTHAYAHHLNRHDLNDTLRLKEKELLADSFAGYHLSKLGFPKDSVEALINNISSSQKSLKSIAIKDRFEALKIGFERRENELGLVSDIPFIAIFPENRKKVDSLLKIAREEYRTDYQLSAISFSKAFQYSNGKSLNALYEAFKQYYRAKDYKKALIYGNTLLKKGAGFLEKASFALLYLEIGKANLAQDNYNQALEFLIVAQELNPDNSEITRLKSEIFDRQTKTEQLIEELEKTIVIGPASAELFFKLGEAHQRNRNPLEAIKFFKRVLLINPNYINARLALSKLYFKEGKDVMHTTSTNDAIDLDYDEIVKTKSELWSKAEKLLKEGLKIHPKDKRLVKELKSLKKAKRNQVIKYPNKTYYTVD